MMRANQLAWALSAILMGCVATGATADPCQMTLGGVSFDGRCSEFKNQGVLETDFVLDAVGRAQSARHKPPELPLGTRLDAARPVIDDLARRLELRAHGMEFVPDTTSSDLRWQPTDQLRYSQVRAGVWIEGSGAVVEFDSLGRVVRLVSNTLAAPEFSTRHVMSRERALAFAIRASGKWFDGQVHVNRPMYAALDDSTWRVYHLVAFGIIRPFGHSEGWQVVFDPERRKVKSSQSTTMH